MAGPQRGQQGQADERRLVDAASTRPNQRRIVACAVSMVGVASGTVVVALLVGGRFPPVLVLLVFVALLALSTNHDVVFPNEYAASADLAVVLASVVAFRHDGALVGPVLLGLLAGPLDVVQWQRRAFVRMVWNAGDRALAALAAAAAFAAVTWLGGDSVVVLIGAAAAAALAAVAVDAVVSLVLVTAHGATARAAWRAVVDIDALQLPLTCAGAAAGFLVTTVGAWAVVPPMLAIVMLPELVQARSRVPAAVARNAFLALEVLVAALVVAPFVAVPGPVTIAVLLVVAVLVGAELVVDFRVPLPTGAGIAVAGAVLVVGDGDRPFAGVVVAAGATAASWCWTRGHTQSGRWRAPVAVVVAASAGALVGVLVERVDLTGAAGTAGVLGFAACALLVAEAPARRVEAMRIVWTVPLAALVVGVGPIVTGTGGILVLLAALAVAALSWCGATPWRSRLVSVRAASIGGGGRVVALTGVALVSIVAVVVACIGSGVARELAVVTMVTAGEVAAAMAITAVRQWRIAPRARVRDATCVVGAAVAVVIASRGAVVGAWWSVVVVVAAAAAMVAVGRPVVGRSDELGVALGRTARG